MYECVNVNRFEMSLAAKSSVALVLKEHLFFMGISDIILCLTVEE